MTPIAFNDLARRSARYRDSLLAAMTRVLDRGWYVLGPELEAFEKEFRDYIGVAHAVGVANGTDALELAFRAVGVGPGDEAIVAANAGMYSSTALCAIGAVPTFADVDDRRLLLDPERIVDAVTPRTRAIVATHLYGRMIDMPQLLSVAERFGLPVVEDCAQAHGAMLGDRRAGSWGVAAAFSFYPTKNLGALGDGGMVVSNDGAISDRVRRLRQYGWEKKYVARDGPARNSRLDDLQAALLRVQLPWLDDWNERRRQVARTYAAAWHPAIRHPDVEGDDYVAHLYVIRTPHRDSLRQYLADFKIATDIHYPLLDGDQPALQGVVRKTELPISEAATREVVSLPCYPELTDMEVIRVCEALLRWTP